MNKLFAAFVCMFFSVTAYNQDVLLLKQNGKVIIGDTTQMTTPAGYNLYVQNGILTEKVKVSLKNTGDWSDDAFTRLPTLKDVALSIEQHKHLLNMPGAESLVANGYELKAMDAKLLEQIEWLWLHMIALEKENQLLKKELESIKKPAGK